MITENKGSGTKCPCCFESEYDSNKEKTRSRVNEAVDECGVCGTYMYRYELVNKNLAVAKPLSIDEVVQTIKNSEDSIKLITNARNNLAETFDYNSFISKELIKHDHIIKYLYDKKYKNLIEDAKEFTHKLIENWDPSKDLENVFYTAKPNTISSDSYLSLDTGSKTDEDLHAHVTYDRLRPIIARNEISATFEDYMTTKLRDLQYILQHSLEDNKLDKNEIYNNFCNEIDFLEIMTHCAEFTRDYKKVSKIHEVILNNGGLYTKEVEEAIKANNDKYKLQIDKDKKVFSFDCEMNCTISELKNFYHNKITVHLGTQRRDKILKEKNDKENIKLAENKNKSKSFKNDLSNLMGGAKPSTKNSARLMNQLNKIAIKEVKNQPETKNTYGDGK